MTTLTQRTFSSGEVSPSLYSRVDTVKYATGLRTCKNMMVLRYGGASNRPGTDFVAEVKDSQESVRLVPFIFSKDQTYILEFGETYMRVHRDGLQVTDTNEAISGVSLGATTSLTITGHSLNTGEEIQVYGVGGTKELNNRNFKVVVLDPNTVEIQLMDGSALDSSSYTAYTSGGSADRVYEIETPYDSTEVKDFKFVQSADIITFAHPDHPPQELLRFGETNWVFQEVSFAPVVSHPTALGDSGGPGGSNNFKYTVTAINEDGVESLPGTVSGVSISNVTNANPGVVTTSANHGLDTGDTVRINNIVGMEEINNKHFIVDVVNATSYELRNVDTTSLNTYTSGGLTRKAYTERNSVGTPSTSNPITITWTAPADAVEFNVYKEISGTYQLLGITTDTSFRDIGQGTDGSETPPSGRYPFLGSNKYPATVSYIQQRLAFANTNDDPEKIFLSKTSDFKNFAKSRPSQSDDSITFQMVGRQLNSVEHLIDLGSLIIMTSSGEWNASGNEAGVIEPTAINTKQYSYNGSGPLPPIIIDGSAVYQQARGSIIRDLGYDYQVDGYRGNDLTIFSSHLFDKFTLVDWTYQQIPHSILWAVRSDGALLGLTFVRNQEIRAWHRHDLSGDVEAVASIPEGNEDFLYVQIKREINGKTVRYIEKMSTRAITDIVDNKFMDSSLTYDGRNTGSTTMTLSGGTNWDHTETLTLTASASFFTSSDIGNEIHFPDYAIRAEITAFTSATEVSVRVNKIVQVALRNSSETSWNKAVDELGGLWHLEGKDVAVFGDGYVVASPNNGSYVKVTVTNGTVSLDKPFGVIHIGLPYLADVETLDIDTPNGETISDKKKFVSRVNMYVEDTRGIWVGPKPPEDDTVNPLEDLTEMKLRNEESYDEPSSLKTDVVDVNIKGELNSSGRIFIRQVDPIPMSILSISPAGNFPFS